jgi:hypothetical protein
VLLGGLWACFRPDLANVRFLCTAGQPECDPGYECREGYCLLPGESPPDLGASMDAAAPDGSPAPPDLATAAGCASGRGFGVGKAWACPGTFGGTGMSAFTLCARGFRLCTDVGAHISAEDLKACRRLPGMFVANVIGSYRSQSSQGKCDSSEPTRELFGCGANSRSLSSTVLCGGFSQVVDCVANTTQMMCPATPFTTVDLVTNPTPTDGVLCCPVP